jgi:hypothetical protein
MFLRPRSHLFETPFADFVPTIHSCCISFPIPSGSGHLPIKIILENKLNTPPHRLARVTGSTEGRVADAITGLVRGLARH